MKHILSQFGVNNAQCIEQIYKSAWNIDDCYILKSNSDRTRLEKSLLLSDLLLQQNIPVPEYLRTPDGQAYVHANGVFFVLMKKINGHHLKPYEGCPAENGRLLGTLLAELHTALQKISDHVDCHDADYNKELDDYILKHITANAIEVPGTIIDFCRGFAPLYHTLPRQLIHRDVHTGNMLFSGKELSGYLDFDLSQKNARLHDLCYLGATMLVGNYQDETRFATWCDIFRGVLAGYNQVCELTQHERQALPYMFVFIELTFTAFFAQIAQPDISASCLDMTKWLFEHCEKIARLGKL